MTGPGERYGPTWAVSVALASATVLMAISVLVLVSHPQTAGLGAFVGLVNQQNQTAKTLVYLVAFGMVLPLSVLLVPRLVDKIAAGPNLAGLSALAGLMVAGLAALLLVLRLSGSLPWGDGLKGLLVGVALWSIAVAGTLVRAAREPLWRPLARLAAKTAGVWCAAGVLVFADLVGLTSGHSLHPVPIALGTVIGLLVLTGAERVRVPRPPRSIGHLADVAVVLVLALAVPNLVIFHASSLLPNVYFPPGVIQNQQDYLLGSANQLLGGGALLVGVPVSQYGVGLVYFLDGWFHLVPIGYGTMGLLDSILTALFYIVGYTVLRIAGVRRLLAAAAMAFAVVGLLYSLRYAVGVLPEAGPLRFGWPMAVVLAAVVAGRWPRWRRTAGIVAAGVLGVTAVWGFEAFAYTAFVYVAVAAAAAWLTPAGRRRRLLTKAIGAGVVACVIAHVLLASATLVITGHLPEWGEYLAYLHSFLLGGEAGVISYGFSRWSPGLAVGAAVLASAIGVLLLMRNRPGMARTRPATLLALVGLSAYAIAFLSYSDNRSSTYLLAYVALPLVMVCVLGLSLVLADDVGVRHGVRRGVLAFALGVAVLVLSSAWPSISTNFSGTALAHAPPGGGLDATVHNLLHPPPIDPRATEATRLLNRYVPGRRALIVLPMVPDLAVETLMRSHRSSPLFISDPVDDSLVPSEYIPRLRPQIAHLHAGQRLLIDRDTLRVAADLRHHPEIDPSATPVYGGDQEDEWLLAQLERRFMIRPLVAGRYGLIVAELEPRRVKR